MANLYRSYVIKHQATVSPTDKPAHGGGQINFFKENGLYGLIGNSRIFFDDVSNSPIKLLQFAIPNLVDDNNPNALQELEVRHDYWTNPENAKKHTLKALYTIPGFTKAHKKMDVQAMARLYREHVINYQSLTTSKYHGGQIAFFVDKGLSGLLSKQKEYLDKQCSPAALLRLTIPELVDIQNPNALKFEEIEQKKVATQPKS
jgi:hypothetical protein